MKSLSGENATNRKFLMLKGAKSLWSLGNVLTKKKK